MTPMHWPTIACSFLAFAIGMAAVFLLATHPAWDTAAWACLAVTLTGMITGWVLIGRLLWLIWKD